MSSEPKRAPQPQPAPMFGGHSWMDFRWYQTARADPTLPEIHVYTDAQSYEAGQTVHFHASTHADHWQLEIVRDGSTPEIVHSIRGIKGIFTSAPAGCYRDGCSWPVLYSWPVPPGTPSGFYRVRSQCARVDETLFEQDHFFVVRPLVGQGAGRLLMVLPTCTYMAYNDWGGANHYAGIDGDAADGPSAVLSTQRPWTRGIVWQPENAPRLCQPPRPFGQVPSYDMKHWSYANGFGYFCQASGWAQYDRHFAVWAEREGYALDIVTQADLQFRPDVLESYACVVIVGHDEYWSREMRLNMEAYVERGGHLARFGGNFYWQIRLEDAGKTQVCYKMRAAEEDPIRLTGAQHLLTTAWEDKRVGWPGASTVGVNGLGGMYASWGGYVARGSRGFTVYRPEHWAFAETELGYGDIFGAEAMIFGYEVDGLDYNFCDGLPFPTGEDGASPEIEILAMSPAVLAEQQFDRPGFRNYAADADQRQKAELRFGSITAETMARSRYGSGMLVHMRRGLGEVLTAGTCEWVMGLTRDEPFTCTITRNVIDRFLGKS